MDSTGYSIDIIIFILKEYNASFHKMLYTFSLPLPGRMTIFCAMKILSIDIKISYELDIKYM